MRDGRYAKYLYAGITAVSVIGISIIFYIQRVFGSAILDFKIDFNT